MTRRYLLNNSDVICYKLFIGRFRLIINCQIFVLLVLMLLLSVIKFYSRFVSYMLSVPIIHNFNMSLSRKFPCRLPLRSKKEGKILCCKITLIFGSQTDGV